MVIKIYISGISGNKEVKKRQQRVLMILESKNVDYEVIDITEPGREAEKEFMQMNSTARDSKYPLPPQIFNDEDYCGDYEDFDMSNEMDELEKFLKAGSSISAADLNSENKSQNNEAKANGDTSSREPSTDKEAETAAPDSLEESKRLAANADEEDRSEKSQHTETDLDAKDIPRDEADLINDTADKNEDKSDDQEQEE